MSYVLTFVASENALPVTQAHLQAAEKILVKFRNPPTCQAVWLAADKAADVGITAPPARETLAELRTALAQSHIDVFASPVERRRKKLMLADMDSTIVQEETLDELAAYAGVGEQVAEITARAMEGKIDFHSALRERVGLLKGLPAQTLQDTLDKMKLSPGAKIFVQTMRANGAHCVLVSGGFTFFTGAVAKMTGFHNHHGNTLGIEKEKLTGKVLEPVLDKYAKVDFLKHYANVQKIPLTDCLTIGDGANDIPMLEAAGLGIGYHPKEVVEQSVDNIIRYGDLTAALYAQGYTDRHFVGV